MKPRSIIFGGTLTFVLRYYRVIPYPERRIRVRNPYPYHEIPCSPVPVPVPVPSLQKQFRTRTFYVPYNSETFRTRTFSELNFFKITRTRTYPRQILLRTRTSVPVPVPWFFFVICGENVKFAGACGNLSSPSEYDDCFCKFFRYGRIFLTGGKSYNIFWGGTFPPT